ncbi:MAG: 1-deoxy-D-xylulose-5-phosphate reductoisomerase [Gammaproteobacteria bacterium]|jgi:1-deoxy-D-xylulose-5-phosphate reductoisomerase|nr:1-deoxy-D-xylulose-5-phosphate reductoisomerase [Gammaproteobacteria bacterium]|tara:strand:- start:13620 stop:14768 length:1149 start_codon:yes stop_codon:yes gene_type:complete
MKNILLLGATGSIGDSVLNVISKNRDLFNLFGISLNKNISKSMKITKEFSPKYVHVNENESLKTNQKNSSNIYLNGDEDLQHLINDQEVDIIVCAISGFAGLKATYMSAQTGKKLLLANKESIVAGGDLILPLAKKHNTEIVPIDSEHNAIFQCLAGESGVEDVKKITITASGGPFLNSSISDLKKVRLQEALNHPNWNMGSKITIDSATLVNKCLELIEARYLFDLDEKYFDLVVHPQSIIHSIVTYLDGSSICQMSSPDMRVPIAHALSDKRRVPINFDSLNFSSLNLSFQEFPLDRMQVQNIAREVCISGSNLGTVFNASNEIAVESFINGLISFDKIYEVIYRTFDINIMSKDISIDSINDIDKQTRIEAKKVVKSFI